MPKPQTGYHIAQTEPEPGNNHTPERWIRGKVLGGSSSVNGMMYVRGQPADFDQMGACGYHAVGTCRMGKDHASVLDPLLQVRGVQGLRVMDTSVPPVMPAGNTNAPIMAMAWRAGDVIKNSAR